MCALALPILEVAWFRICVVATFQVYSLYGSRDCSAPTAIVTVRLPMPPHTCTIKQHNKFIMVVLIGVANYIYGTSACT